MARTTDTFDDRTSGSGAALASVPTFSTKDYDEVVVWFVGAGAAAPTGCTVTPVAADGTALPAVAVTVAIGGKSPAVFGAVPASGVTNAVALGPVPPQFTFAGTGGAASTVRVICHGVRYRFGAN